MTINIQDLPEQYMLMAKPSSNLDSEVFRPRPGYVRTGAIPCGPVVQVVYQRADLVAQLEARLEAQKPHS